METQTYGLLITAKVEHGSRYVHVRILRRIDESASPINCYSDGSADGLERDDLELYGFVSDYSGSFSLFPPCYRTPHSVELCKAKGMVKTLERVAAAIRKAEATEPGDVFTAFAKAVGASWVAEPRGPYSSYADTRWYWHSVARGREMFRDIIRTQEKEHAKAGGRTLAD